MGKVTDRDKLSLQIKGTIEFEFGTLADNVGAALHEVGINAESELCKNTLKRIRDAGNNAIRVINNHVDNYNVSYKQKGTVNASQLAARAMKEAS